MPARRVLLLSRERFYGGFASCFIPWPWKFLKHVLNSSLDCTLIWIAEYVLGDFVFSMAGRSVYGMLYTFIEHSIYKCDRLDWTRPPRASMRKKRVTLSYLYYSTNHVLLDDVNQSFISWILLKCLNRFVMLLETSHNAHSSLVWNWRCVTFSEWKQTAPRPQIVNCKLINSAIIPIMAQSIPLRDDTKNGCVAD